MTTRERAQLLRHCSYRCARCAMLYMAMRCHRKALRTCAGHSHGRVQSCDTTCYTFAHAHFKLQNKIKMKRLCIYPYPSGIGLKHASGNVGDACMPGVLSHRPERPQIEESDGEEHEGLAAACCARGAE